MLAKDTWIADVKVTEQLFNYMEQVGKFELPPVKVLATITDLVKHDKDIIDKNGLELPALGIKTAAENNYQVKDKSEIEFNGKSVKISTSWGGHKFTSEELEKLAAGETVAFKTSKGYKVSGSLAEQIYKGHKFVGFLNE